MKLIIANWKSNKNMIEAGHWLEKALPQLEGISATIVIAPPSPFLALAKEALSPTQVKLGVQDLSPFPAGSYTGAVGTRNVEGLNIAFAILGHSERRRYFHESINEIANKVRETLSAGITPIVCVTKETVREQAHALENADRKKVIVAFEPVEHIGTGTTDTLEDILATKELVQSAFDDVPYIYGGSVDLHTDPKILTHTGIDGFLVGSASLNADEFVSLVKLIA